MNWISSVPVVAAGILVVLLPGLIAMAPMRVSIMARLSGAGVLSVLFVGASGVAAKLAGIDFTWGVPLIPALVGFLAAAALRRRLHPRHPPKGADVSPIALAAAWMVGALGIVVVAFGAVASPDRLSQTYDNIFHASTVASVLATGEASSLTLRTLIETGDVIGFYPAAWHSIVAMISQLSGADIAVSANAAWIAASIALWMPGVAWLTAILARVGAVVSPRVAAVCALPLAAAFGSMPYALLSWGSLYPTFLAHSLLPVAVAATVVTVRRLAPRRGQWESPWLALGGVAVCITAIGFAQPRVLVTWAAIVAPLIIINVVRAIRWAWRQGEPHRARVVWALSVALALATIAAALTIRYLVVQLQLFSRPLDERLGGPQAMAPQSVLDGVIQVVAQSWLHDDSASATVPSLLLAALVACGIVVVARTRKLAWLLVSYAVIAMLFILAAGSDDVVAKLATGLWYKDRFRLAAALPVLAVPFAAFGAEAVVRFVSRRLRRGDQWRMWGAVVVASAVAASSYAVMAASGVTQSIAHVFRLPPSQAGDAVISAEQRDFMERLPDHVPEGQRVLGDPWDGSAWSQVFGGREPVFPHVNGQWDTDRLALAWRLQEIETDPEVCAALDRLHVRYVLYDPHAFAGGDPAGNHFPGPHAAVEADLFDEVARSGSTVLYRIDQCGPLTAG
jgi:hypothetical protein